MLLSSRFSCIVGVSLLLSVGGSAASGATCESLGQLKISLTTIVKAESYEAGKFVPPGKEDPRVTARFTD
jgi:hypothetical protein